MKTSETQPLPTEGEGDIMLALEKRVRERREKGVATCANGCIPSSPRVGCPVHGPKAKPPDPEDLPHPGTGRLLSASPVKPPEPAQAFIGIGFSKQPLRYEVQYANPTPPPSGKAECISPNGPGVCDVPGCPKHAARPRCEYCGHNHADMTGELGCWACSCGHPAGCRCAGHEAKPPEPAKCSLCGGPHDRDSGFDTHFRLMIERADRAERERDEARAELLAWGGFNRAAEARKSVSEVLSDRLVAVERERDAAIKAKEEAEREFTLVWIEVEGQAGREVCESGESPGACVVRHLRRFDEQAEAERKRADALAWQLNAMTNLKQSMADQACKAMDERDAVEATAGALRAALEAVHPPHPQPEICSACALLGRALAAHSKAVGP